MENQPVMDVTSDDKLWAALSYVFAPIVGIILLLMQEKKARPFIKFHAVQSIAVSVAFWILATIITTVTVGIGGPPRTIVARGGRSLFAGDQGIERVDLDRREHAAKDEVAGRA